MNTRFRLSTAPNHQQPLYNSASRTALGSAQVVGSSRSPGRHSGTVHIHGLPPRGYPQPGVFHHQEMAWCITTAWCVHMGKTTTNKLCRSLRRCGTTCQCRTPEISRGYVQYEKTRKSCRQFFRGMYKAQPELEHDPSANAFSPRCSHNLLHQLWKV